MTYRIVYKDKIILTEYIDKFVDIKRLHGKLIFKIELTINSYIYNKIYLQNDDEYLTEKNLKEDGKIMLYKQMAKECMEKLLE